MHLDNRMLFVGRPDEDDLLHIWNIYIRLWVLTADVPVLDGMGFHRDLSLCVGYEAGAIVLQAMRIS